LAQLGFPDGSRRSASGGCVDRAVLPTRSNVHDRILSSALSARREFAGQEARKAKQLPGAENAAMGKAPLLCRLDPALDRGRRPLLREAVRPVGAASGRDQPLGRAKCLSRT